MNTSLLIAALLTLIAGPLHSALGERLIFGKMNADVLPTTIGSADLTKGILRAFWHLVSVAWWGFAAILGFLAMQGALSWVEEVVALAIGVTFLASGILTAALTRGRHFSWLIFLAITAAVWFGIG